MIRTQDLDNHEFDPVDPWGDILAELAWTVCFLYHRTIDATPGQVVFGRDMIFNMLYTPDWGKSESGKEPRSSKTMEEKTQKGETIPTK